MTDLGVGLRVEGRNAEAWPLLGRPRAQRVVSLFKFNGLFSLLVIIEIATVGYGAYNNWGLTLDYVSFWFVMLFPHLAIMKVGPRKSQKGSRVSALIAGAAQAAKLLSLPRLAFGVAMTMALEDLDPMTFSSNSTITGDIDDALAHPATLSWGGVTLAILIQCVLLLLCTPTPTERSRFPFAEISALNCLWCLGVTMTLLSACLWIVTLTGTLPDTADPTRTIVCTVTGIFTLLSTSFQLSLSAARGQCLAQFFNTAVAVAPIALVVLTVIEWPTWWPNADAGEPSSLFTEVLQVTLPLTLGLVALFIILTAARTTAASHRLQRERSRHRQHQFAPTTMRQQRSLLVNDEHRLPSPRTVLPHSSISGQPEGIPPRYADSLGSYSGHQGSPRRSWTSQNDHSAELMEAAELIVAEGLPPTYVEAVGTDARTSQPAVAAPQEPRSGN